MYKAESAKLPVKKNQQITAVYIIHIVIQLRKAPAEMQAPFFGCLFLLRRVVQPEFRGNSEQT
jgi:hypothetical protein